MKYLHLFNTKSEHNSFYGGNKYKKPWLAYIKDEGHMTYNKDYFTIKALEDGNVTITIPASINSSYATSISYSKDESNWIKTSVNNTNQTITISVITGDKVYLKGIAKQWAISTFTYTKIDSTSNIDVCGNVMSLLYGDDFMDRTSFKSGSQYTLCGLFYNNAHLVCADKLKLPATTLATYCYSDMFDGCTALTSAPELPATTLTSSCYYYMFYGCKSLITAPYLPATILASNCYQSMFQGCKSLTVAPALPVTRLASYCYHSMFRSCTSLITAPVLPATTLASNCYNSMFCGCTSLTTAPVLSATTLVSNCYDNMFSNCTSLTTAPELPATSLAQYCYSSMFSGCTSLTTAPALPATILKMCCYEEMFYYCPSLITAPVLPATTLADYCYREMFNNCRSLNYIKAMFTTTPSDNYTKRWVENVASSGTFVKNSAATWNVTGVNGVPSGWTVQTASA